MARHTDACTHADDRFIAAHTAEEEAAYADLRQTREQIRTTLAALPPDQRDWLESRIGLRAYAEIATVHARLCRVFPHLSDVLTYLCFPWRVPLPGHLAADGKPERAWERGNFMDEHYGGDALRRLDRRKRPATGDATASPVAAGWP